MSACSCLVLFVGLEFFCKLCNCVVARDDGRDKVSQRCVGQAALEAVRLVFEARAWRAVVDACAVWMREECVTMRW